MRAADYAWIAREQARAELAPPDPRELADGSLVPVVLLPGVYETWAVLVALARALHAVGHPVHVVPGLGHNTGSLATSAALVSARLVRSSLPRVVLVAHSKGGLIGKLVLGDPVQAERAVGLVAVNAPFGGSSLAQYVPVRSVRALAPGDPAIMALAGSRDQHTRIASLYARFDPHVPDGSWLAGARNVLLPVDGHFRPLGDARVHRLVAEQVAWVDRAHRC